MSNVEFNRLKDQQSAYLKQHQANPVHWYPYGPEALQKAKEEDKPIFLSIGYSSCHWCHVMAGESFSDQETADFLNENFISIKVDREEHPDIDNYYQQACQLFINSGGWPLSAFLLPDMRPYFVGTYYPKDKKGEGATFMELLSELKRAFHEDKEQVETNATNVTKAIKDGLGPKEEVPFQGHFPPPMAVMDAIKEFRDEENGGFGTAPKFPHFSFYEWSVEQILEGMIDKYHGQHLVESLEHIL
ncbi:MAG: thioredoxin domain-containing protein, partial [Halobacteriovoraceae bacterium]|nr:thioredoxin domain-containing protein [Halobacteriovoraceae bacterium]